MKRTIFLIVIILSVTQLSFTQGSIDIDNLSVQMGVASQEHVKITDNHFSVHPDVGQTPLIYGDFGSGNVGIGTDNPIFHFEVQNTNIPTISIGKANSETGGQSRLLFHAGLGVYKNGFSVNYHKTGSTDRLSFVDGGATEVLSMENGGQIGINGHISMNTNSDAVMTFNNTDNSWQYLQFMRNGVRKAWVGLNSGNDFQITKEGGGIINLESDHLKVKTPSGYINIGALNTTWAHIQTDRQKFYFNKVLDLQDGLSTYTNNYLKITTPSGYLLIGPQNSGFSHFTTDRPKFYFNKTIDVNGSINAYSTNDIVLQAGGSTKMRIYNGSGNLQLYAEAYKTVGSGNWQINSDKRLKKDIRNMNSSDILGKLLLLRGVHFKWKSDTVNRGIKGTEHFGFTAQNIRSVFPTLVDEDSNGYLLASYGTFDPMFVEGLRALKNENNELRMLNEQLRAELEKLRSDNDRKVNRLQNQINLIAKVLEIVDSDLAETTAINK